VFAERGLDAVTGLEICKRAGVNGAAINYYFGGMAGLNEAVLIEARSRLPSLETLSAAIADKPDARAKLRAVFALALDVLTGPPTKSWIMRLLMREILSPSPAFERLFVAAEGLPKLRILKAIVAEIMDLPEDHPAVALGCISAIAPVQVMLIGGREILERAYPELDRTASAAPVVLERMVAFALGGLDAIARPERAGADQPAAVTPP
jgi:AcrR family transcriptional regulator